jgi:hypothetical protein
LRRCHIEHFPAENLQNGILQKNTRNRQQHKQKEAADLPVGLQQTVCNAEGAFVWLLRHWLRQ